MPDNAIAPGTKDPASAQSDKSDAAKADALQARIAALDDSIKRIESGLAGQRSLYDRQLNALRGELQNAQRARRSYDLDDGGSSDPVAPQRNRADLDPAVEHLRMNQEILKFQFENPEYRDLKEKVDAILNDSAKVHSVLTYNDAGKIDFYRTYRVALLEVQNQLLKEAKAAGDQAKAQAEKNRSLSKADATLSGVGAEEIPQDLSLDDLENMTAEEMEEKGLVPGLSPTKKRPAPVGLRR